MEKLSARAKCERKRWRKRRHGSPETAEKLQLAQTLGFFFSSESIREDALHLYSRHWEI